MSAATPVALLDPDDDGVPLEADLDADPASLPFAFHREETERFLDIEFGDRAGWVAMMFGLDPYWDAGGTYKHRKRENRFYLWPRDRAELLADVAQYLADAAASGRAVDCYLCPHMRRSRNRHKHDALPPRAFHADLDGPPDNRELYEALDLLLVDSGTSGHVHAYGMLDEPCADPARWDQTQVALRDGLGGKADAKIADNDLLRLVGTVNCKPWAPRDGRAAGPPTRVRMLPGWSGRLWSPAEFAERLGVDMSVPPPPPADPVGFDTTPPTTVPLPETVAERVTEAIDKLARAAAAGADRSPIWHSVIRRAADAGYSRDQAYAITTGLALPVMRRGRKDATRYEGTRMFELSWCKVSAGRAERQNERYDITGDEVRARILETGETAAQLWRAMCDLLTVPAVVARYWRGLRLAVVLDGVHGPGHTAANLAAAGIVVSAPWSDADAPDDADEADGAGDADAKEPAGGAQDGAGGPDEDAPVVQDPGDDGAAQDDDDEDTEDAEDAEDADDEPEPVDAEPEPGGWVLDIENPTLDPPRGTVVAGWAGLQVAHAVANTIAGQETKMTAAVRKRWKEAAPLWCRARALAGVGYYREAELRGDAVITALVEAAQVGADAAMAAQPGAVLRAAAAVGWANGLDEPMLPMAADDPERPRRGDRARAVLPTAAAMRTAVLLQLSQDDRGNGLRFHAVHGRNVAWVPDTKATHVWNGQRWETDSGALMRELSHRVTDLMLDAAHEALERTGKALDAVAELDEKDPQRQQAEREHAAARAYLKWTRDSRMDARLKAAITCAVAHPHTAVRSGLWDAHPQLLNVGNGTLRLLADGGHRFGPHRRGDRLTQQANVRYDPAARCPRFKAHLRRVLPDLAVRRLMRALAGLALVGDNAANVFPVLIGKSRSGKTTVLEVLALVLANAEEPSAGYSGSYTLATMRPQRDSAGPNAELFRLTRLRYVYASEGDDGLTLSADLVKRFCGGDRRSARDTWGKAAGISDRVPAFVPFLGTNRPPQVEGADPAVRERLVAVPFDAYLKPTERIPGFAADVARDEAAGILNWMLAGYRDVKRNPQVIRELPQVCVEAAEEMYRAINVYQRWLSEETQAKPKAPAKDWMGVDESWHAFVWWCRDANEPAGTKRLFGAALAAEGFPSKPMTVEKVSQRLREGLVWSPDARWLTRRQQEQDGAKPNKSNDE